PTDRTKIITSKYQYGLPLYRQETMFKQYGIDLSRKTMAQWMINIRKSASLGMLIGKTSTRYLITLMIYAK
ncbi:MAG: transposase, partial [Paraglaciecola sp.]